MKLGQKLAEYRKNKGITQSELGEYLNISPQAISKWENDLSEPDIATLKKLAWFYGVSIPDLLGDEDNAAQRLGYCVECGAELTEENIGNDPKGRYCKSCLFELEKTQAENKKEEPVEIVTQKSEYEDIYLLRKTVNKSAVLLFAIIAVFAFAACILEGIFSHYFSTASFAAGFIFAIMTISVVASIKKESLDAYNKKRDSYCEYAFYSDRVEYKCYNNDQVLTAFYRIPYSEIETRSVLKSAYVFTHNGIAHLIPKRAFKENSEAPKLLFNGQEVDTSTPEASGKKRVRKPDAKRLALILEITSIVLFILAIVLLNNLPSKYWWISVAFIPFPVVSAAIYFSLHKKGIKNLSLHIVATVILSIAMIFVTIIGNSMYHQEQLYMEQAEQANELMDKVGIDFSFTFDSFYEDDASVYDESTRSFVDAKMLYCYLTDEESAAFRASVDKSPIWTSTMSDEMKSAYGSFYSYYNQNNTVFFIYNVTDNTYNTLPPDGKTCEYIFVAYDISSPSLDFVMFSK